MAKNLGYDPINDAARADMKELLSHTVPNISLLNASTPQAQEAYNKTMELAHIFDVMPEGGVYDPEFKDILTEKYNALLSQAQGRLGENTPDNIVKNVMNKELGFSINDPDARDLLNGFHERIKLLDTIKSEDFGVIEKYTPPVQATAGAPTPEVSESATEEASTPDTDTPASDDTSPSTVSRAEPSGMFNNMDAFEGMLSALGVEPMPATGAAAIEAFDAAIAEHYNTTFEAMASEVFATHPDLKGLDPAAVTRAAQVENPDDLDADDAEARTAFSVLEDLEERVATLEGADLTALENAETETEANAAIEKLQKNSDGFEALEAITVLEFLGSEEFTLEVEVESMLGLATDMEIITAEEDNGDNITRRIC